MLFDTHVHLNDDNLKMIWKKSLQEHKEAGVSNMVVVGFDRKRLNEQWS